MNKKDFEIYSLELFSYVGELQEADLSVTVHTNCIQTLLKILEVN